MLKKSQKNERKIQGIISIILMEEDVSKYDFKAKNYKD